MFPPPPQAMFYAVTPLLWCPHLEAVRPIPEAGLDATLPCQDCGTLQENWVCLSCYEVCNREWDGTKVGPGANHRWVLIPAQHSLLNLRSTAAVTSMPT